MTIPATLTRAQLWVWVSELFGLGLPHRPFTPGHSTPLDFLADAYNHPGQDVAAWANRSGIKTLAASILAGLEFLRHHDAPLHAQLHRRQEGTVGTRSHAGHHGRGPVP